MEEMKVMDNCISIKALREHRPPPKSLFSHTLCLILRCIDEQDFSTILQKSHQDTGVKGVETK